MTVYIDPVIGAALVHLGLPILPALPCPTCRGTGWRCRNSNLMCTHRVHQGCPDCNGSGVWTPPDSPVPIGVTSEYLRNSARYGPWIVRQPVTGLRMDRVTEPWTMFDPRVNGSGINIAQSSMIGEGTLRPLKVVDFRSRIDGLPGVVEITHGSERRGLRHWFKTTDRIWDWADISSALPFLPGLKPEDTVYLLDGFTESVECPEWHDSTPEDVINEVERRLRDEEWSRLASDRCRTALLHIDAYREGKARSQSVSRLSCPFPVDAPDHPCVQP